jgi:hypothetical protein
MQQSCTYGSVRGASGQPASLPRHVNAHTARLPTAIARDLMPHAVPVFENAGTSATACPGRLELQAYLLLGQTDRSKH